MARKKQKIEVVVHMGANAEEVFGSESMQLFWTEKIMERLQKGSLSTEDRNLALSRIAEKQNRCRSYWNF